MKMCIMGLINVDSAIDLKHIIINKTRYTRNTDKEPIMSDMTFI
jgi:hypothetical protein